MKPLEWKKSPHSFTKQRSTSLSPPWFDWNWKCSNSPTRAEISNIETTVVQYLPPFVWWQKTGIHSSQPFNLCYLWTWNLTCTLCSSPLRKGLALSPINSLCGTSWFMLSCPGSWSTWYTLSMRMWHCQLQRLVENLPVDWLHMPSEVC